MLRYLFDYMDMIFEWIIPKMYQIPRPDVRKVLRAAYECMWDEENIRDCCMDLGLKVLTSKELTRLRALDDHRIELLRRDQRYDQLKKDYSSIWEASLGDEAKKEIFWKLYNARQESSISDRAMEYMQSDRGKKVLSRIKENKAKKISERNKVSNTIIKTMQG